jgi:hypothetical protein
MVQNTEPNSQPENDPPVADVPGVEITSPPATGKSNINFCFFSIITNIFLF